MINFNTLQKLFKTQISTETDSHKLRRNVAINKMYILRKMGLKFQNPIFNTSYKIAFWNKQNWLTKIMC